MTQAHYIDTRSDSDGRAFDVLADSLPVARVEPSDQTGDWVMSSRAPLWFADVSIPGDYDDERAQSSARGWIENHLSELGDADPLAL